LGIIRRHRLWEFFLAEKLKFNWDEVHEVAEQLEHVSSKKLIDKLDEFLDFPKFDPHGDPIPDTNGKMETGKQISLSELQINKASKICHIANQTPELLEYLHDKKTASRLTDINLCHSSIDTSVIFLKLIIAALFTSISIFFHRSIIKSTAAFISASTTTSVFLKNAEPP